MEMITRMDNKKNIVGMQEVHYDMIICMEKDGHVRFGIKIELGCLLVALSSNVFS